MKIPRLFTAEQFKDYLKEKLPLKEGSINMIKAARWDLMNSFLEYQKQSLKKEMFVNELEKPNRPETKHGNCACDDCCNVSSWYLKKHSAWQEAEKKVIFIPKKHIELDGDGVWFSGYFRGFGIWLHDLAEATNGELELQNVEL